MTYLNSDALSSQAQTINIKPIDQDMAGRSGSKTHQLDHNERHSSTSESYVPFPHSSISEDFTAAEHQSGVPIQVDHNEHVEVHEDPINSQPQKQKSNRKRKSPIITLDLFDGPSSITELGPKKLLQALMLKDTEWQRMRNALKDTTKKLWLAKDCENRRIFELFNNVDPTIFKEKIATWSEAKLDGPDEISLATDLRPRADWSDLLNPESPKFLPKNNRARKNFYRRRKTGPVLWTSHSEATQALVSNPIFSHKKSWYAAKVLRYLKNTYPIESQQPIEYFAKYIPMYKERIELILALEQDVFDDLLRKIVNSFELRFPVQGDKESQLAQIRGILEARKAWYYALEMVVPYDGETKAKFHDAIQTLRPKEYEKKEELLSTAEAHRIRTQARVIYWHPWAFQDLFQKGQTGENRMEAAEMFLRSYADRTLSK
ncbi:hypothetical protein CROQUDRAFT_718339 [Cronartium quercuum f. sp. fusiforme G11]|uniref:Uncharacterized protein n=1 Tax=Cronartium quercuum f. sp. fusiforme G11 TaxID=708437 RepID=A0A9P6NC86_9BASI|nr:hypothetical protein CROQUDRAFT_718339 [Cronartium quercuum f. sp. fusiforme G11]